MMIEMIGRGRGSRSNAAATAATSAATELFGMTTARAAANATGAHPATTGGRGRRRRCQMSRVVEMGGRRLRGSRA